MEIPNGITIRTLQEEELTDWFLLCGLCFAKKGTPSTYFQQHWECDPSAQLSGIFVAVDMESGELVSTVRVFHRSVRIGESDHQIGGIGEVGTLPSHRNRGLSSSLLKRALKYVQDNRMRYSVLHAAEKYVPFYQKFGWQGFRLSFNNFLIQHSSPFLIDGTPVGFSSDPLNVATTTDEEVERLETIFSSMMVRFDGLVVRKCASYWRKWIAFRHDYKKVTCLWLNAHEPKTGYCFARINVSETQVDVVFEEFAFQPGLLSKEANGPGIFQCALHSLLHSNDFSKEGKRIHVVVSQPIAEVLCLDTLPGVEHLPVSTDDGLMYNGKGGPDPSKHVFFGSDSF